IDSAAGSAGCSGWDAIDPVGAGRVTGAATGLAGAATVAGGAATGLAGTATVAGGAHEGRSTSRALASSRNAIAHGSQAPRVRRWAASVRVRGEPRREPVALVSIEGPERVMELTSPGLFAGETAALRCAHARTSSPSADGENAEWLRASSIVRSRAMSPAQRY